MPPTTTEIPIGAYVEVTAGPGYVRFCGSTSFAAGKWVGVELIEPKGKNNGSVGGIQYFECAPLHGVFVRPSQAKMANAPVVSYLCLA
jgi:dynactin 1